MNLIITNEFNKMDILKKLTKEKKFNNYKFYSFNELKRKLFFDYDNKTIEYVMKKYNVNLYTSIDKIPEDIDIVFIAVRKDWLPKIVSKCKSCS